jgi:hypothetical protein
MMRRLGYYEENITAYHLTNIRDLSTIKKNQRKRNVHLSCFTKGGYELARLPSQPNVLVVLQGDSVIKGDTDIWTVVSERGRRWLDVRDRVDKKLTFLVNGVIQKTFNQLHIQVDAYKISPKELQELIEAQSKSTQKSLYGLFLRNTEEMINRDYVVLNNYLRNAAKMSYNEVVLDKYTVQGVYTLPHYTGSEALTVIKELHLDYLGEISFDEIKKIGS